MTSILILDSGIGGLTVLNEIRHELPNCQLDYISDNSYLPYGPRSEDDLCQRVKTLIETYRRRVLEPSMIVIACNTASTVVLPFLREIYKIPIVGIVPAIKPAARLSRSGHIALLATIGTVARAYTDGLIDEFAENCHVRKIAADVLVNEAEKKMRNEPVDMSIISAVIEEIKYCDEIDTVILGCTHFPFLQAELEVAAGRSLLWLNPASAVAKQCRRLLGAKGNSSLGPRLNIFYTGSKISSLGFNADKLLVDSFTSLCMN